MLNKKEMKLRVPLLLLTTGLCLALLAGNGNNAYSENKQTGMPESSSDLSQVRALPDGAETGSEDIVLLSHDQDAAVQYLSTSLPEPAQRNYPDQVLEKESGNDSGNHTEKDQDKIPEDELSSEAQLSAIPEDEQQAVVPQAVDDANAIKLSLNKTSAEVNVAQGENIWFSFTPAENGFYELYSSGNSNTACDLYDAKSNLEIWNYGNGVDNNFLVQDYLEADNVYYYCCSGNGSSAVFTVTLKKFQPVTSGSCGTNLDWSYDMNSAVLKISGTGTMLDFNYAPWYVFRKLIVTADLSSGITSIGDFAFKNCSSLVEIVLPDSVKSIGYMAFYKCHSLTSAALGNGVTSIDSCAFWNCYNLAAIIIPEKVTKIENYTFAYCYDLVSVVFKGAVTEIGSNAFTSCSDLVRINIPEKTNSIGDCAFSKCSNLKFAVFYGAAPSAFGTDVFSSCSGELKLYYIAGKKGWTSPVWNGYQTDTFTDDKGPIIDWENSYVSTASAGPGDTVTYHLAYSDENGFAGGYLCLKEPNIDDQAWWLPLTDQDLDGFCEASKSFHKNGENGIWEVLYIELNDSSTLVNQSCYYNEERYSNADTAVDLSKFNVSVSGLIPDREGPIIDWDKSYVSSNTAEPGDTIVYRFAYSDVSGLNNGRLILMDAAGNEIDLNILDPEQDGIGEAKYEVDEYGYNGDLDVSYVYLADNVDNGSYHLYGKAYFAKKYYPDDNRAIDLSAFSVTLTGLVEDTTPPVVDCSHVVISPLIASFCDTVRIEVPVTDDLSGVDHLEIINFPVNASGSLMSSAYYDSSADCFVAYVRVLSFKSIFGSKCNGECRISVIEAYDKANNCSKYYFDEISMNSFTIDLEKGVIDVSEGYNSQVQLAAREKLLLSFIPETSGNYMLTADSVNQGIYLAVYDEDYNILTASYSGKLAYSLEAGKKYFYCCENSNNTACAVTVSLAFDSIIWDYNAASHILTISGTGDMFDYTYSGGPWNANYKDLIEKVIISEGITAVGANAFRGCSSLNSVAIGSNVKSMGDSAFHGCSSLTGAYFYGNAPTLGSNVFAECAADLVLYYIEGRDGWTATTWNGYNTAAFIPETAPVVITAAAVAEGVCSVTIAARAEYSLQVFAAAYNESGKMLSVAGEALNNLSGTKELKLNVDQSAAKVKVFLLDAENTPLCREKTVD